MQNPIPTTNPPNWQELGLAFEERSAEEILRYSCTELLKQGHVIFLTAFGPEGCVVFEMLAKLIAEGALGREQIANHFAELESSIMRGLPQYTHYKLAIVNLDTGYQFKETLELKTKLEEKYKFKILMLEPELSVAQQDANFGARLYERDPDQCCYMRKLKPLDGLLGGKLSWITSIRRDQTDNRASAMAFEFDRKFKLGKINPLIKWTKSDIWKYIHENNIPYNPLLDQGYESIGCEPCTSPGTDRSKGRWAGKDKIECGLHIQDEEQAQGGEFVI